jgi:hypothetical protein
MIDECTVGGAAAVSQSGENIQCRVTGISSSSNTRSSARCHLAFSTYSITTASNRQRDPNRVYVFWVKICRKYYSLNALLIPHEEHP